jgi:hypothetical protein
MTFFFPKPKLFLNFPIQVFLIQWDMNFISLKINKFGLRVPFMIEIIPHTEAKLLVTRLSLLNVVSVTVLAKGISPDIGVLVLVSDLNQNSGVGRTLPWGS